MACIWHRREMRAGGGRFVLDFADGGTSTTAGAIVLEGIADGSEVIGSVELV